MSASLERQISFKVMREKHRVAYYATVTLAWALLAFILLLDLVLLASTFSPGTKARIVGSGSMQPTIKTGSIVVTRPQDEYAVGDVIIFDDPRLGPNMHRIIEVRDIEGTTYYATQGDAFDTPDHLLVPIDRVEGKVEMVFPYLGYVAFIGSFAAMVPIIIVVLYFLRKRRTRNRGG
jgi:signal peptidase I